MAHVTAAATWTGVWASAKKCVGPPMLKVVSGASGTFSRISRAIDGTALRVSQARGEQQIPCGDDRQKSKGKNDGASFEIVHPTLAAKNAARMGHPA